MQKGARARYGAEHDIRVQIDPKHRRDHGQKRVIDRRAGRDRLRELKKVSPRSRSSVRRLSVAQARLGATAVVGKIYEESLPPFEFGRVQTQMARQVVMR
jgi:N utilization substance protein A